MNITNSTNVLDENPDEGTTNDTFSNNLANVSSSSTIFDGNAAEFVINNFRTVALCIVVSGIIGNVFAVIILSQTFLRKQTASIYLGGLCVTDTLFLLVHGFELVANIYFPVVFEWPYTCGILQYISSVTSFISVWLVVAFTAERYVAVCHPLSRTKWCSRQRAWRTVKCCIVLGCILNTPVLYVSGPLRSVDETMMKCGVYDGQESSMQIFNAIDLLFVLALPVVLIIGANVYIWKQLVNDRSQPV